MAKTREALRVHAVARKNSGVARNVKCGPRFASFLTRTLLFISLSFFLVISLFSFLRGLYLSVCLSVCLSVTPLSPIETVQARITKFLLWARTLVFL